eukprot:3017976-Prorocentrum_lima.AAC.1
MEYPQPHIANGLVMVTKIGALSLQGRMHKFFRHGAPPVAEDTGNVHGTVCGTCTPIRRIYDYAPFQFASLSTIVAVAIM